MFLDKFKKVFLAEKDSLGRGRWEGLGLVLREQSFSIGSCVWSCGSLFYCGGMTFEHLF